MEINKNANGKVQVGYASVAVEVTCTSSDGIESKVVGVLVSPCSKEDIFKTLA